MASVSHTVRRAQARRTAYLAGIAALLGVAGGGAAWVLVHLIGLITNVVLFHQFGWDLPSFADFHPGPILLLEAAAGGLVVVAAREVVTGHQGSRHSRGHGGGAHPSEPDRAARRRRQAGLRRGGDRHRWAVRRRGPDHRHRRRDGFAHRPADPRDPVGTQDPARVRCRRGHGGDVRRAARRGRAGDRAPAVRVLPPRVRAAGGGGERRRRHARAAVQPRAVVPRADPQLRRARQPARLRAGRDLVRIARGGHLQGALPRWKAGSGACRSPTSGTRSSAPWASRASASSSRVHSGSATTASTTCSPTGSRSACWRCCSSASSSRGGSPSARARRGARSRRSCSSAAASGASSARSSTRSFPAAPRRRVRSRSSPWPPRSVPRRGDLHRHRVRVRAHARLPGDPADHARRGHRRPRRGRAARPRAHDREARTPRSPRTARLRAGLPAVDACRGGHDLPSDRAGGVRRWSPTAAVGSTGPPTARSRSSTTTAGASASSPAPTCSAGTPRPTRRCRASAAPT